MKHRIRCPRTNRMTTYETSRPYSQVLISQFWFEIACEKLRVDRDDGIVGYRYLNMESV
jgi:hypothetical protein